MVHVQAVAVFMAGLGHERDRASLLQRDLAQHLLDADHPIACSNRICGIEVELELSGARFVVPTLDRNAQAIQTLQHDIEELQLLSRVEVQVSERRQVRHRGEIVMFLGFGFLQLNMDLLFQNQRFPPIRVLGTGKGLSKDSISEVELELDDIFVHDSAQLLSIDDPDRIKIVGCTCGELFFEFQRYLTRAR